MKFRISNDVTGATFEKKYAFLDNDFLTIVFNEPDALYQLIHLSNKGYLLVAPITRFEFLRDVFLPAYQKVKQDFLNNDKIFAPAVEHQLVFSKENENAMILSRIYAHNNCKGRPSVPDLLLAGRAIMYSPRSLIITGNRKDFPSTVFDTVGMLNFEHTKSDNVQVFTILQFNKDKYQLAVGKLSAASGKS